MKKSTIDRQRPIIAHCQSPVVAEPGEGALDDPAPPVAPQRSAILRRRFAPTFAVWNDRFDPAATQLFTQPIAIVATVHDHALGFLSRSSRAMPTSYADRGEGRLRELDFRRGCRVKVVSQRNTRAVDHHHPLRPLAPLGFSDCVAPFLAGAKLPSRNDSLHFSCCRSFNSLRNARQISSQTSCSSQSRKRRQHVAGEGNSSGKSHQRAPLRKIHKMPSSTLRSSFGGRPPFGRLGRFGSKGRIISHWASVSSRPYRAIGPPSALLPLLIAYFGRTNYCKITALYPVLKQLLEKSREIVRKLELYNFAKLHGAWPKFVVSGDPKLSLKRSPERYLRAIDDLKPLEVSQRSVA